MSARMEKYASDTGVKKRTQKNERLYSKVSDMNIDYVDIDVDNAVDLSTRSSSKTSREDFQKQRELNKILPSSKTKVYEEETYVEPKEERVYDINEILKMARQDKLFEDNEKKRLINTEYNILTKLDVNTLENDEMKKEDLKSLIDDIYKKEAPKKERKSKKYSRSEEAKLLSDLFEENEEQEETVDDKTFELQEEASKEILSKDVDEEETETEVEYEDETENEEETEEQEEVATQVIDKGENEGFEDTTTMYDFGIEKKSKRKKGKEKQVNMLEGVNLKEEMKRSKEQDEEYEYMEEKEGKGLIIAIVIVVILILVTCGFFVYEYFFGMK